MRYVGRFAPSPTGPLHLGSLFTALASYLEAKAHSGLWQLRIDDIDTPRVVKNADTAIFSTLETFGLHWDGEVYYQSKHLEAYADALQRLEQQELLYPCYCSRKTLANLPNANSEHEVVYPGYCRLQTTIQNLPHALRIKTDPQVIHFVDYLQGSIRENLAVQHGDFIVQRKDQIFAYQLAVVIDDHLQGVTHVVRGVDLRSATIKQLYLHNCLNLPTPNYLHVPVITNPDGSKLSKKAFAPAVQQHQPNQLLFQLLQLLQQQPPSELQEYSLREQLAWAIEHWQPQLLHITHSKVPVPGHFI